MEAYDEAPEPGRGPATKGQKMNKPLSDCIVERRSNITVSEVDKKLKKMLKDVEFSSSIPADTVSQLSTVRKALKDLEKFSAVKE